MTAVTVGDEFEEKRTLVVVDGSFPGVLDSILGGDDIHSVDLSIYASANNGNVARTWIPGILSPRVKYSVLEELRADEVPMPYLLFSQTKMVGRFHSLA